MPQGPCEECVKRAAIVEDLIVAVFCKHNNCSAVYQIGAGIWRMSWPSDKESSERFQEFLLDSLRAVKKIAGDKARLWN